MLYNKAIFEPVEADFNEKRVRARRRIQERRNEIYERFPQYKEIEKRISALGIKMGGLALGDGDAQGVEDIKNEIKQLSAKRIAILENAGLPGDYIHDVYECKKCNDSGYADGKYCECFVRELRAQTAKRSNIAAALRGISFDDFDLSYYPDVTDETGKNPRRQMTGILNIAAEFMDNFGKKDNKNLIFYGSTGLGKTFLSAAIANRLAETGITVMYYTAKQLLGMLTENEFNSAYEKKADCSWAYNVDLLIIDDLGSELITTYTVASLFDILNARMLSGGQMIINTNLAPKKLAEIYSARIFSRLTEFEFLKFIGKDIREIKNTQA